MFFITYLYFWLHWVFIAAQVFLCCDNRKLLFVVVSGLLTAVAPLVAKHGLQREWASLTGTRGFSI